jgi:hypothetical protein
VAGDERLAMLIEPENQNSSPGRGSLEQEGDGGLHGQVNRT